MAINNDELKNRITQILPQSPRLTTKSMFGGIGFFYDGKVLCCAYRGETVLRLGNMLEPTDHPQLRQMDITGKPMKGWYILSARASQDSAELERWLLEALDVVKTMPAKAPSARSKPKSAAKPKSKAIKNVSRKPLSQAKTRKSHKD